jgi:hypothetical protein
VSSIPTVLAAFLLSASPLVPCRSYIATPNLLKAQIESRGARVVLEELYNSWADASFTEGPEKPEKPPFDCWGPVLEHIGGGSKAWLEIGWHLLQESDAGASQMLYQAIDDALDTNPTNVLQLVSAKPGRLSLDDLCGSQIPVWAESGEVAHAAITRRRSSLAKVSDPALRGARKRCFSLLTSLDAELPRFYQVGTAK